MSIDKDAIRLLDDAVGLGTNPKLVEKTVGLLRAIASCDHSGAIERGDTYCGYCGARKENPSGFVSFRAKQLWYPAHVGLVAKEIIAELDKP